MRRGISARLAAWAGSAGRGIAIAMVAAVGVAALGSAVPAAAAAPAPSSPILQGQLIKVSDLPSGWLSQTISSNTASPCLQIVSSNQVHLPKAQVAFSNSAGEVFAEGIYQAASPAGAVAAYKKITAAQHKCNHAEFKAEGHTGHIVVSTLHLPKLGAISYPHTLKASAHGGALYANVDTLTQGRYVIFLAETNSRGAKPNVSTETQLNQLAFSHIPEATMGTTTSTTTSTGATSTTAAP